MLTGTHSRIEMAQKQRKAVTTAGLRRSRAVRSGCGGRRAAGSHAMPSLDFFSSLTSFTRSFSAARLIDSVLCLCSRPLRERWSQVTPGLCQPDGNASFLVP